MAQDFVYMGYGIIRKEKQKIQSILAGLDFRQLRAEGKWQ